MASGKTARRLLPFPKPTDADKLCADIEALANALDNDAQTLQGTLAERPAAGTRGRLYMVQGDATPANNGIFWWDTGTTWLRTNEIGSSEGLVVRAAKTKYFPSASRAALVTVTLVFFNGSRLSTAVIVPPGGQWEVKEETTTDIAIYVNNVAQANLGLAGTTLLEINAAQALL